MTELTASSQHENGEYEEAGPTDDSSLPLYNLQLAEVVLWQLDIERTEHPIDLDESSVPDYSWGIERAPDNDTGQPAAKLSMEYKFPAGQTPYYILRIELVGIFVHGLAAGEDQEEPQIANARSQGGRARTTYPQRPLNDYTVMTLLWPYVRELLHQLQLRMRVPLYLLPTLDVANLQAISENTTDIDTEQE